MGDLTTAEFLFWVFILIILIAFQIAMMYLRQRRQQCKAQREICFDRKRKMWVESDETAILNAPEPKMD